jgi:hypothetical protein
VSDFGPTDILDAVGVPLSPGQRVVYAVAGIHASGQLKPGTIVRVRRMIRGRYPERVDIRRDDRRIITLGWSKRVLVLRQESEADGWLRRQLATVSRR